MDVVISVESVKFPLTGIGRYTYELTNALATVSPALRMQYFDGNQVRGDCPEILHQPAKDERGYFNALKEYFLGFGTVVDIYRLLKFRKQSAALSKTNFDIYHGTNFYLPQCDALKVSTFHDLSPFKYSECMPGWRVRYMQRALEETIRISDYLITDSEFTRHEISEYFGYPKERITAVPLACSGVFYPRNKKACSAILKKYGLEYKLYSLYVGTIEPRKNISTLIRSYQCLPISIRRVCPLILVGYYGWNSEMIHQEIRKAESEGWCKYIGFVEGAELPVLFSGAKAFIFPSLYEGFGLPVLEAMASGTAVVASTASSIPEVCGGVALLTDPDDIDLMSEYLNKALEDDQWNREASRLGVDRSREFSWRKCANMTHDVYLRLATGVH